MDKEKLRERSLINKAISLKNVCADTLYCEECIFYSVKEDACNINGSPSEWNVSGKYKAEE